MTPDQIDAIRTFARGLPSDGTAPDTAILQLAWDYEDLQSQLAAANERADGLQRIVDEARAQKPVCITTLDDFCTVVAYPPPNVLHSVPLYAAAPVPAQPAVVPTYEIVMSSGRKARLTATELVDRLATCRDEIERLRGERRVQPAVVPKHAADRIHEMRDVLFDIATSDVMGDRPEHSFVTVAINRDTLSRAAILSTTDTDNKATEIFPGTADALAKLSIKPKE